MNSIISPASFLEQRATLAQLTEAAAKAAEEAREAEQHQLLALAVMKEVLMTAARLANAETPFAGGELRTCMQADGKQELGKQAVWSLYRGRIGLFVLSTAEAHLAEWSTDNGGFVIMTTVELNALRSGALEILLEELKAIAPADVNPKPAATAPVALGGGGSGEQEE